MLQIENIFYYKAVEFLIALANSQGIIPRRNQIENIKVVEYIMSGILEDT